MALGHPKGLFPLFFTEMWERLAFYTMLGVLLLYTTDLERGGLGLSTALGNEIYGLYLAFVYFTPFIGGMLADRFLGYRRAVLLGGLCMATGLFLMGTPGFTYFVVGLAGLIIGNGFFKPNISVMVGNLYEPGDPRRDAGFNIFYMGINIGALVANFLAASLRNEFGWLWTFRAAGFGLLISLAVLLTNWRVLARADRKPKRAPQDTGTRDVFLKLLLPAFAVGVVAYFLAKNYLPADVPVRPAVVGFLAGMLLVIGFFVRLGLKATPEEKPGLLALLPVYVAGGTFFMILHLNGSAMTQWARDYTDRRLAVMPSLFQQEALPRYYRNAGPDVPRPDPRSLLVVDDPKLARMFGLQRLDERAVQAILRAAPRDVRLVTLGEGGGEDPPAAVRSRAVNVYPQGTVSVSVGPGAHGEMEIQVTVQHGARPLRRVAFVRTVGERTFGLFVVDRETYAQIYDAYRRRYGKEPTYLPPGEYLRVVNPEEYQSANPLFVIMFTPLVIWFFEMWRRRGRPITTARKIFLGLILTTLSLLIMTLAGLVSRGGEVKVSALWLVAFYVVVTLGELCISPMSLSLVTKLAPQRLVGLVMGGWFLATAFGNNLSGFFGGIQYRLAPHVFFLILAGLAALVAVFIRLLLPQLEQAMKKYGA